MTLTRGQLAALAAVAALLPITVNANPIYAQCGGIGWNGGSSCDSGTVCTYVNDWYSQCLPGTAPPETTTTPDEPTPTETYSDSPTETYSEPPSQTTPVPVPTGTGLDAHMKSNGRLYFGTCSDSGLLSVSQNADIIKSDFGQLTPENSAKWDTIEASQGSFNYGPFDTLVNFAQANGKLVRGHTFVWHSQLPSWVSNIGSGSALTTVIQNHISNIGKRYAGKIYAWDVCNEIFNDDGTYRSSVFYNRLGTNFVAIAFNAARAADPNAKLYINDYNLDNLSWAAPKVNAVVNLVNTQRAAGTPIDGIGSQSHLDAGWAVDVQGALTKLASTGAEVALTELDIKGASASDYSTVVKACLSVPKCVGITVWGISDKDSWRKENSPLLFDSSFQKKAAYNAVISALPWQSVTTSPGSTPTSAPITTAPVTTSRPITPSTTSTANIPAGTGLDARFKAKGKKYFGTCSDSALLSSGQNAAIIRSDFGALTPENSAKWDTIEGSQGNFNFGPFDTLVNFAQSNGKLVRGHTFVWHSQLPSWVSNIGSGSTLTTVIQNHISTIGKRYAGKIYAWDVVNEIFNDDGSYRSSVFYNRLGTGFVAIAFKAARAADPSAKLYINDYNLDNLGWAAPKVNAVVNLVKAQLSAGTPIDGIGSQSHLEAGGSSTTQATLNQLASAGVDVAITELDIKGASANDYSTVVKACLAVSRCIGITVWGISDKDSWRKENSPLLYDSNFGKKSAYNAVFSALA